jgi:hypothetical protein
MKKIKLSGREMAVLRAMDNLGNTGAEIMEKTQISSVDLADILAALADVGYVECYRPGSKVETMEHIKASEVMTSRFEINPSYAQELKKALQRY